MNLIQACVANPVKVAVGVLLLSLFGILALLAMPTQLTPEVQIPTITVETRWRGASPMEVEREIVQPLEEQLRSVEGLVKLSSESGDSGGVITLEFPIGTDMSQALVKVNTRVQQVRDWPINADRPVIRTASGTDNPIAWFILAQAPPERDLLDRARAAHPAHAAALDRVIHARSPDLALYRLRRLAAAHPELADLAPAEIDIESLRRMAEDEIESRLERVDGVSSADVVGGRPDELQVIVDPQLLAARGLSIDDLRAALANQNQDTSGGDFWEGKRRYVVRTIGQFHSPEQVEGTIVSRRDGKPVYVRDIARVHLGKKKADGVVRRFGASNLALRVTREQGANVLDTVRRLRAVAADVDRTVLRPRGLGLTMVYDETTYIDSAVGLVKDNIVVGGLLTVATLLLFLRNLRLTLVVAVAIPVSVIGTFLALALFDRSLNVVSLAGMAFAVGMLVDNAVVVLENIFTRWTGGDDGATASVRGAGEVWGAVLASTLTTVAVFLPVLFVREEAGQLFGDIALAISVSIGLSLVVSVLVVPVAAAWLLGGRRPRPAAAGRADVATRFGRAFTAAIVGLDRRLLASAPASAVVSAAIVALSAVATWLLVPKVEYLPQGNRNLVFGILLPPPGYNLDELLRMGETVEKRMLRYWDVDPGTPEAAALDAPILADMFFVARGRSVFLGMRALDPLEAGKLVAVVRQVTADMPGTVGVAKQSSLFEQGLSAGRTIDIEITGPDLGTLVALGGRIMGMLPEITPGSQNFPRPSLDLSSPEVRLLPRLEQSADMRLDARQLGYMVDCLVDGGYATDYYLDADRIDLVIKGDDRFVQRTQDLRSLPVVTPGGQLVPLESVAVVEEYSSGPEQILHRERQRAITIQVSPAATMPLEEAQERILAGVVRPLVASGDLAGGYAITLGGTADKLRGTWQALWFNLALAGLITYLLMAALFESWFYPAVIIAAVPLGGVGGLAGLAALNFFGARFGIYQPLDVLTMLGFVILIGTVVNNPILIVEQALFLVRSEGRDGSDAIVEAVRSRVRPIFMTTLTTVLGLLPLVLFPGAGSELYRGLGAVLLGGLLVATLVTLVLVPLLLGLCFRAFGPPESTDLTRRRAPASVAMPEPDLPTEPAGGWHTAVAAKPPAPQPVTHP
ncbi:MAG: efflux RND transporter permease subunit [Planctomycetes bacterium]|nr:efflux RND transporter permease subunit [Planctomycetota bacterium]